MKNDRFISFLLVGLMVLLSFLFFKDIKVVNAESIKLSAGREIDLTGLNGNLNNINIKIEFNTPVNLDGKNNALLIALLSSDNTVLTDTRFISSSTDVGIYDENGIAIIFENAPTSIGSKTFINNSYTYTVETKDFTILNSTKNIKKLVVVGQKGEEISTEISFSEIKYSVKFGENSPTLYSYNALISAPTGIYT